MAEDSQDDSKGTDQGPDGEKTEDGKKKEPFNLAKELAGKATLTPEDVKSLVERHADQVVTKALETAKTR